jgi:chromosome segregation ATPase
MSKNLSLPEINMPSKREPNPVLELVNRFITKLLRNFYYNAKESIGEPKRDIVVYQVERACATLQDTRNEFEDALTKFKSLVHVSETSLDHKYNLLNRQYQFCRAKSESVNDRIRAIEEVSEALFKEWENELTEYSDRQLRNASKQQLKVARQNYNRLIKTMRQAESKIHPVLSAFKDQVLFLKHNLNAKAISTLHHEFNVISLDISQLIMAMELTISEASQFVSLIAPQKKLVLPSP